MDRFKYLFVLTLPILILFSFFAEGWKTFLPLIQVFALIPIIELFFRPKTSNYDDEEEKRLLKDPVFDWMLYLIVPVQWTLLIFFFFQIGEDDVGWVEKVGRISAMGLGCGVLGINVAYELGHRTKQTEKFLAKSLLLTSLYMHFIIEHNRGHHKNVSTMEDPSSARYGEPLYAFWWRSVSNTYMSAWNLENKRLKRLNIKAALLKNEMIRFTLIQGLLLASILIVFGVETMIYFIMAAIMGFLLLETVNYIEHYGLRRKIKENGTYERTMPWHSWNSDHIIGRMMLFELSRHSDHHYIASRKYQVLRHIDGSPQMPTGYPGMMLISLIPPLWFRVMHEKLKRLG